MAKVSQKVKRSSKRKVKRSSKLKVSRKVKRNSKRKVTQKKISVGKIDDVLMTKLISARGVSGDEKGIRDIIIKEVKKYADEIRTTKMGNLIVRKKGKGPRLMMTAHMDEIGLMVKSIDKRGKIYFSTIGGIISDVLVGEKVHVRGKKGKIFGVITTEKISNDGDIDERLELEDMYVDTGYWKKSLTKLGVEIGNYIEFEPIGTCSCHKKGIVGKALDDRLGCYVLIQLLKMLRKSKYDLHFVFTVQEEIGAYGSKASSWEINPERAIVVDVTPANDNIELSTKILGKGPVVTVKDEEIISDRGMTNWLKETAKKINVPLQLEVTDVGSTDALGIAIFKTGVPTAVIGVAIRNIHTTFSMAHRRDITDLVKVLLALLKG
jgi:tetrahedral aminopeptidase